MALDNATPYRFTVTQFGKLVNAIFAGEDRVELVAGHVLDVKTSFRGHAAAVATVARVLRNAFGDEASVVAQQHLTLSADTQVLPDLVVLRSGLTGCSRSSFCADDALLVVEVSNEVSLELDRNVKSRLYASAGIPEYWVVDLSLERVTVLRTADAEGYREQRDYDRGDSWESLLLRRRTIAVDEVIPGRE
jgi:Uma2 family endonuclease